MCTVYACLCFWLPDGSSPSTVTANPQTDQTWRQAQVPISGSQSGAIIIEGIVGNGIEGDIAIDDLSVTRGQCSVSRVHITSLDATVT